jgi:hypothetical protein
MRTERGSSLSNVFQKTKIEQPHNLNMSYGAVLFGSLLGCVEVRGNGLADHSANVETPLLAPRGYRQRTSGEFGLLDVILENEKTHLVLFIITLIRVSVDVRAIDSTNVTTDGTIMLYEDFIRDSTSFNQIGVLHCYSFLEYENELLGLIYV